MKNHKIVVFGAGVYCIHVIKMLKELNIYPELIVDNDKSKNGQIIEGIEIVSFECWVHKEKEYDSIVVSTVKYTEEIINQLLSAGINSEKIITFDLFSDLVASKKRKNVIPTRKYHILYDGQIFEDQKRGGISRYYYELVNGLAIIQNNSTAVVAGKYISEIGIELAQNYDFYGERAEGIYRECSELRHKYNEKSYYNNKFLCDIYHPTYYRKTNIENYKYLVTTVYDMIHEKFGGDKATITDKRNMIKKADMIIAISENTKKDILNYYDINPEKVKVIYLGNSLENSVEDERIISDKYVLYVGNRGGYKNALSLIEAYAYSKYKKEVKLVFFGGGKFTTEESIKINELGIDKNVLWLEGEDDLLANLYAYAEVFVYPSKYEGFGIPILEAMHYGTPVITANVSSMPEVGGDAALYFDPNSVESLTNKIDEVLDDKALRKRLSNLGIEREKLFSWEKCVNQTYKLYSKLLREI